MGQLDKGIQQLNETFNARPEPKKIPRHVTQQAMMQIKQQIEQQLNHPVDQQTLQKIIRNSCDQIDGIPNEFFYNFLTRPRACTHGNGNNCSIQDCPSLFTNFEDEGEGFCDEDEEEDDEDYEDEEEYFNENEDLQYEEEAQCQGNPGPDP